MCVVNLHVWLNLSLTLKLLTLSTHIVIPARDSMEDNRRKSNNAVKMWTSIMSTILNCFDLLAWTSKSLYQARMRFKPRAVAMVCREMFPGLATQIHLVDSLDTAPAPSSSSNAKPTQSMLAQMAKCPHVFPSGLDSIKPYSAGANGKFKRCQMCTLRWKWIPESVEWIEYLDGTKSSVSQSRSSLSASPKPKAKAQATPRRSTKARSVTIDTDEDMEFIPVLPASREPEAP